MPRLHGTPDRDGPQTRRGHYSEDGAWWWDDDRGHWYRVMPPEDTLQIELEDHGHSSVLRSIATTLTGTAGAQSYRFVGRVQGADPHRPTDSVASDTFPVLPLQVHDLDHLGEGDAYAEEITAAFRKLEQTLVEQGWRLVATGDHWWSEIYTRPALEWDAPADAPARGG